MLHFLSNERTYAQGRNRHIFLRGQSHFSWFFPGVKCFFPGRKFPSFTKVKSQKKKKKSPHPLSTLLTFPTSISNFPNFPSSLLQFSTFLLQFSFFSSQFYPFFHFSLPLFFPIRRQKFPGQKSREGHSASPGPTCYATSPCLCLTETIRQERCENCKGLKDRTSPYPLFQVSAPRVGPLKKGAVYLFVCLSWLDMIIENPRLTILFCENLKKISSKSFLWHVFMI